MSELPNPLPPEITPHPKPDTYEVALATLTSAGVSPLLAAVLAARGVKTPETAMFQYAALPAHELRGLSGMVKHLLGAILRRERILIVADYDCDGASACSIAMEGLGALGADIGFMVPNRFIHGYGLTPAIVGLAEEQERKPRWILTVDNGIASHAGVEAAKAAGIDVLVTDHHLAAPEGLPAAAAIVNPNQPGCTFSSKALCGAGVAFYVVLATAAALAGLLQNEASWAAWFSRGAPSNLQAWIADLKQKISQFRPEALLDLLALATVADVVGLDDNNRLLVHQGLLRIKAGLARPGIKALFQVAKREPEHATASDFGFSLGPRINAAGRLADMTTGIRCLLASSLEEALPLARQLDQLNRERKDIEVDMQRLATLELPDPASHPLSLVLFGESFHEGVVGIMASRLKEIYGCPVVVFAPSSQAGLLKGSGRSVPGFHLRDALDRVSKIHPGLLQRFGGHAMAAGMTITESSFRDFRSALSETVKALLPEGLPSQRVYVDTGLDLRTVSVDEVETVENFVWGQGFTEPLWQSRFDLLEAKLVGSEKNHLKLLLGMGSRVFPAMYFFCQDLPPQGATVVDAVFHMSVNRFRGQRTVDLLITTLSYG